MKADLTSILNSLIDLFTVSSNFIPLQFQILC